MYENCINLNSDKYIFKLIDLVHSSKTINYILFDFDFMTSNGLCNDDLVNLQLKNDNDDIVYSIVISVKEYKRKDSIYDHLTMIGLDSLLLFNIAKFIKLECIDMNYFKSNLKLSINRYLDKISNSNEVDVEIIYCEDYINKMNQSLINIDSISNNIKEQFDNKIIKYEFIQCYSQNEVNQQIKFFKKSIDDRNLQIGSNLIFKYNLKQQYEIPFQLIPTNNYLNLLSINKILELLKNEKNRNIIEVKQNNLLIDKNIKKILYNHLIIRGQSICNLYFKFGLTNIRKQMDYINTFDIVFVLDFDLILIDIEYNNNNDQRNMRVYQISKILNEIKGKLIIFKNYKSMDNELSEKICDREEILLDSINFNSLQSYLGLNPIRFQPQQEKLDIFAKKLSNFIIQKNFNSLKNQNIQNTIKILENKIEIIKMTESNNISTVKDFGIESVGCMKEIKGILSYTFKLKDSNSAQSFKSNRKGVLLSGPPGTGKTFIAKALSSENSINFISCKGPEIINAYVGETEKNLLKLFNQAKDTQPCVLFFDEFDSIASNSQSRNNITERIISQLCNELDNLVDQQVQVIGATNRIDLIDDSLKRPGRFDSTVYTKVYKDQNDRFEIFVTVLKNYNHQLGILNKDNHQVEKLINKMINLKRNQSGADYKKLCETAKEISINRIILKINNQIIKKQSIKTKEDLIKVRMQVNQNSNNINEYNIEFEDIFQSIDQLKQSINDEVIDKFELESLNY